MDEEVVPVLHVEDAGRAVTWYERLGFRKEQAGLLAVAFVLAGCGGGWEGGKTPGIQTVLHIRAWPQGKDRGALREWRLHCDLAGGTHPAPEKACEQLFDLAGSFAPTPADAVCTEIYGGPAVAEVEGLYRGETVDAEFMRTDGCEIARWDRHAFLFPVKRESQARVSLPDTELHASSATESASS